MNSSSTNPVDALVPLLRHSPDIALLSNSSAWQTITASASRYGVAPLIAHNIRSHVSKGQRSWCDETLVRSWRRHEHMTRNLAFLSGLFVDRAIPAIALKGPLLAMRYYEPPFLRKPSIDLDFAIARADLDRACEALASIGYKSNRSLSEALEHSHHLDLQHPSRPTVELHFRLSHRSVGLPVEQFFERAITWSLPDKQQILVLNPVDQLLHLILHVAHSRFGTLFHLAEILRVRRMEPETVTRAAVGLAIDNGYSGVLQMLDVALRTRFGEPFLPNGVTLPATWLNSRITPELYYRFERWAVPGRGLDLRARLHGCYLDMQVTDSPRQAAAIFGVLLKMIRTNFTRPAYWGTVKQLRFVPPGASESK